MKRTMSTKNGARQINTRNGIKTATGSIYLKDLKDYKPNADGYNEQLAEAVYEVICDNEALWDQGNWRRLFDLEERDDYLSEKDIPFDDVQAQLTALLAFEQDKSDPMCGTAMCFAGWVNELAGSDWLVDSTVLKAFGHDGRWKIEGYLDTVLVPRSLYPKDDPCSTPGYNWMRGYPDELVKILTKRGFSNQTHITSSIPAYAIMLLNPPGGEGAYGENTPLFAGDNGIEGIREILDEWHQISADACLKIKEQASADA